MSTDTKHRSRKSKSDRHKSDRHSGKNNRRSGKSGRRGDTQIPVYSEPSMNLAEFCERHRIGRSTYYELQKKGLGPVTMRHLGRIVRISAEANRDWVKKMETEVVAPVPALAEVTLEDSEGADTSEVSDEIRMPKHRAKPDKTQARPHAKHRRHVRAKHRDPALPLFAGKPEHDEESDEATAGNRGVRRETKHDGKRGRHHRHHRRG